MSEDDPAAPVVFQCGACRRVLGDTLSFVASDESAGIVTLARRSPHVAIGSEILTQFDTAAFDYRSTYSLLNCSCGAALGRLYHSTPRSFDHLRDCFSLSVSALSAYQLGSGPDSPSADFDPFFTVPSALFLLSELRKVQKHIVEMEMRFAATDGPAPLRPATKRAPKAEHNLFKHT
ncbi:hypothetical protein MDAP_001675 [Mitosporidium daphniae]